MRTAEQEFEHACQLGRTVLEHFESHHKSHPPHFLPMARALLFYTSTRAGFGLGMEHGSGFIISRLPYAAACSFHSEWSPPWFVTVNGVEWGAIAGAEKICGLVGLMSERAVKDVSTGSKLALGSDYSICLPGGWYKKGVKKQAHPEIIFDSEYCCAAVSAAGVMVDIGISGILFRADIDRNKRCYGPDPHAHQVLGGDVEPRHELDKLIEDLRVASRAALVASFEPSFLGSEISEEEE